MTTLRVKCQARSGKNESGALKLIIVLMPLYGLQEYLDNSLLDDFLKSVRVGNTKN